MDHKPGFYFIGLKGIKGEFEYGTLVALVKPNGKVEKIYIGDNKLMVNFITSDEWYSAKNSDLSNWEYIGL